MILLLCYLLIFLCKYLMFFFLYFSGGRKWQNSSFEARMPFGAMRRWRFYGCDGRSSLLRQMRVHPCIQQTRGDLKILRLHLSLYNIYLNDEIKNIR